MNSTHSLHLFPKATSDYCHPTVKTLPPNILCIICSMLSTTQSHLRMLEMGNIYYNPLIL